MLRVEQLSVELSKVRGLLRVLCHQGSQPVSDFRDPSVLLGVDRTTYAVGPRFIVTEVSSISCPSTYQA